LVMLYKKSGSYKRNSYLDVDIFFTAVGISPFYFFSFSFCISNFPFHITYSKRPPTVLGK
jgi:hypothetical protein